MKENIDYNIIQIQSTLESLKSLICGICNTRHVWQTWAHAQHERDSPHLRCGVSLLSYLMQ